MKTINVKSLGVLTLLLCSFSFQTVFAEVPLKKDNSDPGSVGSFALKATSLKTSVSQSSVIIPVTADIVNGELSVFFDYPVGIAQITVVDSTGAVVEYQVLDTNTSLDVYIPITGLSSGNYTLKISYGTTHLSGSFQL